jgi:TIR domain
MAPKLFISYRRDDSAGHAGRVHDRLQREFGRDLLFMDVDSIPLGTNFVKVIADEVAKCDALLAIIGPGWLDARDEKGNRRLENPDDFVRIEIGTALKRGIRVIPVLLEGTRVPKADQLPDNLKELAFRNALEVRHASFSADMDRLICGFKGAPLPPQPTLPTPRIGRFAGAAVLSFLELIFVFAGLTGPDTERAFLFGIPCLVVAYWLFTKK